MIRIKQLCTYISLALVMMLAFSMGIQAQQNINDIKLIVTFDGEPTEYSIYKAPLKYNKQFAFSFQVDDGTIDLYNKVYPQFNNLKFTDGCGNDIVFTASSSLYCFQGTGKNGPDMHDPLDPSFDDNYLTWDFIKQLYDLNYGVYNHSLSTDASTDPKFMDYSINRNRSFVRRKMYSHNLGRNVTTAFVCPNQLSEWANPAFSNGYRAVMNKDDGGPIGLTGGDVNGSFNWSESQQIKRREAHRVVPVLEYVDELYNQSKDGSNYWGTLFTHLITDTDVGEHYPQSVFNSDFATIASVYGKGSLDNILLATAEEVYDYLNLRDAVSLAEDLNGNTLEVTFSGSVPSDLRYYAMSLLVESDVAISSIVVEGSGGFTKNLNTGLVNFKWDDQIVPDPQTLAETYVADAELSGDQWDAWIAMDYVYTIPLGPEKIALVERLCNLPDLDYEENFCDITIDTVVKIFGDSVICLGETTTLTATTGMEYYEWSTGESSASINISPVETTEYWVKGTLNGNQTQDFITVVVNAVPNIISNSPPFITHIPGINDTLWVSVQTDTLNFLWNTNDTDSSLIVDPVYTTDYYVDVMSDSGCITRQEFNVVVSNTFDFTYDSVCFGEITHIVNTSSYPDSVVSVMWDLNSDGIFDDAEGDEVEFEFPTAGNHLVGMRSMLEEGEMEIIFQVIPVGDYPIVDFEYDNVCLPGSTSFDDFSTSIVGDLIDFFWEFGDGGTDVGSFVSHTYSSADIYNVKLVVTTTIGCNDSTIKTVEIGDKPILVMLDKDNNQLYQNDTSKISKNDSLYVTIQNASSYDSIIWNNEINEKYFFVTEEGEFYVDVYELSCVSNQSHIMAFTTGGGGEPSSNDIMNLFTPNGDGYNDKWVVNDPNIVGNIKLSIYNRYGKQVYTSDNYNNDWEGTFNDVVLPQATYYYVIEDAENKIFKGPVTILR